MIISPVYHFAVPLTFIIGGHFSKNIFSIELLEFL